MEFTKFFMFVAPNFFKMFEQIERTVLTSVNLNFAMASFDFPAHNNFKISNSVFESVISMFSI